MKSTTQSTPSNSNTAVSVTDLALPDRCQGKVRDIYRIPAPAGHTEADRLLIVATDRISAFDIVLPTPLPGKGRLLTEIAAWWLRFIEEQGICRTHLVSTDAADLPDEAFKPGATTREDLTGRVTIGRRCSVIPIECVVRGYIEGSGLKDYRETGSICGVAIPAGLGQCDRLPEPIFTPATKAEQGEHDENISFERAAELVGKDLMETLRNRSLDIYKQASEHARGRGLIIADTKFEFGFAIDASGQVIDDDPIVIDEALTPDSSRFWPADQYEPGHAQPSFDKQFVREHLQRVVQSGQWDKTDPGPELPEDVVRQTLAKYAEARDKLIG